EPAHVLTVFPRQLKEFSCRQIRAFLAQEGLKSPAQVGTLPGLKAITACNDPVVTQSLHHDRSQATVRSMGGRRGDAPANRQPTFPIYPILTTVNSMPLAPTGARVPGATSLRASPRFRYSADLHPWSFRLSSSRTGESWTSSKPSTHAASPSSLCLASA